MPETACRERPSTSLPNTPARPRNPFPTGSVLRCTAAAALDIANEKATLHTEIGRPPSSRILRRLPGTGPQRRYRNATPYAGNGPSAADADTLAPARNGPQCRYRYATPCAGNSRPPPARILQPLPWAALGGATEKPLPIGRKGRSLPPRTPDNCQKQRITSPPKTSLSCGNSRSLPPEHPDNCPKRSTTSLPNASPLAGNSPALPSRILRRLPWAALDVITALRLLLWLLLRLVGLGRLVLRWLCLADSGLLAQVSLQGGGQG